MHSLVRYARLPFSDHDKAAAVATAKKGDSTAAPRWTLNINTPVRIFTYAMLSWTVAEPSFYLFRALDI